MIKVLQVSKMYPPDWGGIETVVFDLVEALGDDIQCDVICISPKSRARDSCIGGGKPKIYRCSSMFKMFSVYFSFGFFYRFFTLRNKYDVLHLHLPNPIACLAVLLFKGHSRLVVHWHSDIVRQRIIKKIIYPLQSLILRSADKIIVTSPQYALCSKDLKDYLGKVETIPIGIDPLRLIVDESVLDNLYREYHGKRIVFSLGRHVYYKGFEYLIDAAKYLSDEYLILLGGEGPLTRELKERVIALGLQERVVFTGKIPSSELGSFYSFCDVFVLPSIEKSEAFGVVQLEAMSAGKPVISTRIPGSGVPWVNRQDVSGIIVPPRCSKDIAEAIIRLVRSPIDPVLIIEYFTSTFSRDVMAAAVKSLYEDLC